jgi:MraZ protein
MGRMGINWDVLGYMGIDLLTGEFKVTLDDNGRISLPANLRRILDDAKLTITQCKDNCLWVFPSSEYTELLKEIQGSTNPLIKDDRGIRRRLFNSHPVEIDKAGRIPIAQSMREYAGLTGKCTVLGQGEYIEIWDDEHYRQNIEDSDDDYIAASEKLGNKLKNKGNFEE